MLPFGLLILLVLIDQGIKFYVKHNFTYGQSRNIFGDWFKLYFIENEGMAFGLKFGGIVGKLLLTGFRIAVACFGAWYLYHNIKKSAPVGFLIAIALIMAGAIGNIIDSIFYGVIFHDINAYVGGWFQGHVVDMFYAPMWEGHLPKWLGGGNFIFFSPIWNFADACITTGVVIIILGQKRFFRHVEEKDSKPEYPHLNGNEATPEAHIKES